MSFENPTPTEEKEPRYPTAEEIRNKLESLCKYENPETVRIREDEKGVYLHEMKAFDEKGDAYLYLYRRTGNFAEVKAAKTTIEVYYFSGSLEDDMCVGGDTLATYDETSGLWRTGK